ncbi:MAG: PA2779 family protein [Deltaproteobacteria bacterium]|nr:PA2779 family protein [Deltaproteobacteria bacterium]
MSRPFAKCVSWYLVLAMFIIGVAPRVDAGLSPSEVIALSQADRTSDLQKIQKILETKMIGKRLEQFGFSSDEIKARLGRLNDQEIHQFALRLDEIKIGGGGFEVIVVLLLIGILIGLWLHVSGKKVVIQNR